MDFTLTALLDSIGEGFVAYDRAWRIVYMNGAARRTLSAASAEADVLGQVLWDAFPALAAAPLGARYRAAMASQEPAEFEEWSPVSRRWFLFRLFPSGDGLSVLVTDITERRQAADVLRASETRFRSLFEHSIEGMLLTSPSGEIHAANPAACRILGRDERAICEGGRAAVVDIAEPGVSALLDERRRRGYAAGELMLRRGDGTSFPAQVSSAIFVDAEGNEQTSLSFRDLSDAKRAAAHELSVMQALRESEELLRLTMEHAPIGKALVSLGGRFLRVNQRLAEVMGYSLGELTSLRVADVTHPEDREVDAALRAALLRGDVPRYQTAKRYLRRDGGLVEALVSVSLLRAGDGSPGLYIAQIEDVTERRRTEQRLAIAERMVSIGLLAGGLAHEINNPLAVLFASLDSIAEEVSTRAGARPADELAVATDTARGSAERIGRVIKGLNNLVGTDRARRVPVDVREIVELALAVVGNEVRHRAQIERDLAPLLVVEADPQHLTQVLANLLLGAVQGLPDGRADEHRIAVRARGGEAGVVVEITSAGLVASPDEPERFDPSVTVDEAIARVPLSLSVSYSAVAALGGSLDVVRDAGGRATIRVRLPASVTPHAARSVVPARGEPDAPLRGRLLIVDDEVLVARALGRLLQRDHEVVTVHGGRDALARIDAGERFDLILCDVMMPEMPGAEVHAEIRARAPDQARRMVFVTGGAFTPAARAFLARVPNPRLDKPVDGAALRAWVQARLAELASTS